MSSNDLSPEALRRELRTKLIGQNILHYPKTPSTMDAAKQAIRDGAVEGTVVIADQQTFGRGRLGREWFSSPKSSILLSIILYPKLEYLPRLTMAACLAVVRSIEKLTGLEPTIKWPNDVLIDGKKVSGILIESDISGDSVKYAIVGIALNVNFDPTAIPDISETATSLKQVLGREVSRKEVLVVLLGEFEGLYNELRRGERIDREWHRRLDTLGKKVSVRCGDKIEDGVAQEVDGDGNLILRRSDGSVVIIAAGDVTLRAHNY
ncbi:MAG: biotin--[acetyl-CoA-carboxylase] ligase [Dehalococcoidia bacterium]|nr:biotin--[acetyl-CoA-carboxylase] ligase [Dehalococcoidia bacterium]